MCVFVFVCARLCVYVHACMCVCVCMHACVCSQASRCRATLILGFFFFLSFAESFVVEQQTLFGVALIHISMISDQPGVYVPLRALFLVILFLKIQKI